jgi:hypothetical protein
MTTSPIEELSQQEIAKSNEAAEELRAASAELNKLEVIQQELRNKMEGVRSFFRGHLQTRSIELVRQIRAELTKEIAKGGEKSEVIRVLGQFSSLATQMHDNLVRARSAFEDEPTLSLISGYIREAGYLVAYISDLSQRASKDGPALDLAKLSSNPDAVAKGESPGFISLSEARSRLSK